MVDKVAVRPEEFKIERAERRQARLRFAICAASNGGKTWTALEMAFGICEELITKGILTGTVEGKVGLIDTERQSASLYAHLGPFDTIQLGPPYSVERYVSALTALERAGCAVIILDSISHAWMGDGGVLQLLNRFEDKDRWSGFGKTVNPAQDGFVDAMLKSPAHIIATMRSRTKWVLQEKQNRAGHQVMAPKRVGMQPIQRPGIEFEFTTMVDLETDTHAATVVKNRCPLFDDWRPRKLTREDGRALTRWLLEGAPEPTMKVEATPLELATAGAHAGIRQCTAAGTLPDLQRVYEAAIKALRTFAGKAPDADLIALRDQITAAKDARKQALKPEVTANGCISLDDAVDLGDMCTQAKIPTEEIAALFHVKRLALIPSDKLAEAVERIEDETLARETREEPPTVPARLAQKIGRETEEAPAAPKKDPFEGFADDIPWQP